MSFEWMLETVPDLIEPAIHPHHRQFFHSWLFAGALAYGVCNSDV
jgi:hypothetical protein